MRVRAATLVMILTSLWPSVGHAQMHPHGAMSDTSHASPTAPGATTAHDMSAMSMGSMHEHARGMYGPYGASREASGTSWQPEAAGHRGVHAMHGPWTTMLHGYADLVYDDQGGPRGDTKLFSGNMVMATAQREVGRGVLGLRSMLSLEPATIGKEGYPLLLQTGETADGVTPLIDRQHPHDLFMELAGAYSVGSGDLSGFVYGGLPGEPALGPPAYMHRLSGLSDPVAPITHHWLDATHISYGVLTAGVVMDRVKVEASAFRGREPDENRWDIETPKLDSYSYRISYNPTERWALQVSRGRLKSPESLEPDVDQNRFTASAMVDGAWGQTGRWETTLAWGENRNQPGHTLDAFLAEFTEVGDRSVAFARAERVEKDELFVPPAPQAGQVFAVGEMTVGYRWDFLRHEHAALGLGAVGTVSLVPSDLHDAYGSAPISGLLFVRAALR